MPRLALAATLLFLAAPFAMGQVNATSAIPASQTADQPAKLITFDVVSIKLNKSGSGITFDNVDAPLDGYAVKNMSLKTLISNAYGIREDLISSAPPWVEAAHYDIVAKVAGSDFAQYSKLSKQQHEHMLQSVLADRFKLVVHTKTKDLPIYELTFAKSGPKLKEAKPEEQSGWGVHSTGIEAEAMSTSTLAGFLAQHLQKTVVDKTGLAGTYDFKLKWADDRGADSSSAKADGTPSDPSSGPSLFTAIEEQLGLKLQPAKGPVDTLVIDHIERPSEN
jgi:uncharacterized protein (TIGR03435 family)